SFPSTAPAMALTWGSLEPEQMRKKSATPSSPERSSPTMSIAFLEAAAAAAKRSSSGAEGPDRGLAGVTSTPARGSVVTLHGVVDGRVQGAPGRAGLLLGEEDPRLLRQGDGTLACVVEPAGAVDQPVQARPLRGGPALPARQGAQPAAVALGRQPQRGDQGQRHLALGQVVADGLAGHRGVAQVIEQIVHDLERHADLLSEL